MQPMRVNKAVVPRKPVQEERDICDGGSWCRDGVNVLSCMIGNLNGDSNDVELELLVHACMVGMSIGSVGVLR
ncbi:unnamed protein product [Musa hybrid cultivar]